VAQSFILYNLEKFSHQVLHVREANLESAEDIGVSGDNSSVGAGIFRIMGNSVQGVTKIVASNLSAHLPTNVFHAKPVGH